MAVRREGANSNLWRGQGFSFRWNGAHTVNVWRRRENIDVFSVGDFAQDAATVDEVVAGIRRYLAGLTMESQREDWEYSGDAEDAE
jgi:hypothetical protein